MFKLTGNKIKNMRGYFSSISLSKIHISDYLGIEEYVEKQQLTLQVKVQTTETANEVQYMWCSRLKNCPPNNIHSIFKNLGMLPYVA